VLFEIGPSVSLGRVSPKKEVPLNGSQPLSRRRTQTSERLPKGRRHFRFRDIVVKGNRWTAQKWHANSLENGFFRRQLGTRVPLGRELIGFG
jgi:hypothetical protein